MHAVYHILLMLINLTEYGKMQKVTLVSELPEMDAYTPYHIFPYGLIN